MVTANITQEELTARSNACWVKGSVKHSRKSLARLLAKDFQFGGKGNGSFRTAQKLVKTGYTACNSYYGPVGDGSGYVHNCTAS